MDNGLPFLKKQIRKTQVLLEDTQTLKHEVQKISQREDSFSLVELNYFIQECAHSLFILLTSYKDIKGIDDISDKTNQVITDMKKRITQTKAPETVKLVISELDELYNLLEVADRAENVDAYFNRYRNIKDQLFSLRRKSVAKMVSMLELEPELLTDDLELIRSSGGGEKVYADLESFASERGFKFCPDRSNAYYRIIPLSPQGSLGFKVSQELLGLNVRPKASAITEFIRDGIVDPEGLVFQKAQLDKSAFNELVSSKATDEVEKLLKDLSASKNAIEDRYRTLISEIDKYTQDRLECHREAKRVIIELKNREPMLSVVKNNSSIKIEVAGRNVVKVKGYTFSYSDYEGTTAHVDFEGLMTLTVDEQGKVEAFDDISLGFDGSYDGWDEEEASENILDDLQNGVVFEWI